MKIPHKTLERKLLGSGYDQVIGVDEVGMGCLAGPVVVCAVALGKEFFQKSHRKLHWLRDSKLLLPHQREKFAEELLKEKNLQFKITYCHPKTIDKLNIYQAARKAMRRAVSGLISHPEAEGNSFCELVETKTLFIGGLSRFPKSIILVDGPHKIAGLKFDQQAIVKGDQKVFTIACASILAKVFRDKMMIKYAKKFPSYGFEKHKGYGTKEHLTKLTEHGSCVIHRKSFTPVSKLI